MNSEEMIKILYGSAETQKMFIFCMLLITANRLQTLFDQSVPDLSLKQIILLAIVRYSKEPMTFTQLAKLLGCSRQNVKKLADVLVKKGYVTLQPNPEDQRSVCLYPTDQDGAFHDSYFPVCPQEREALFEIFTDEEVETLFHLLHRLQNRIDEIEEEMEKEADS